MNKEQGTSYLSGATSRTADSRSAALPRGASAARACENVYALIDPTQNGPKVKKNRAPRFMQTRVPSTTTRDVHFFPMELQQQATHKGGMEGKSGCHARNPAYPLKMRDVHHN